MSRLMMLSDRTRCSALERDRVGGGEARDAVASYRDSASHCRSAHCPTPRSAPLARTYAHCAPRAYYTLVAHHALLVVGGNVRLALERQRFGVGDAKDAVVVQNPVHEEHLDARQHPREELHDFAGAVAELVWCWCAHTVPLCVVWGATLSRVLERMGSASLKAAAYAVLQHLAGRCKERRGITSLRARQPNSFSFVRVAHTYMLERCVMNLGLSSSSSLVGV